MKKALLDLLVLSILSGGAASSGLILAAYTDASLFWCFYSTALVYMSIGVAFLSEKK